MAEYLSINAAYWQAGLDAPNVESFVFRLFGRTRQDLGLTGNGEALVDFGCGQGAAVNYFTMQGLNAWGCDISERDIAIAKIRYPHIARKFVHCDTSPAKNSYYAIENNVACVTAFQALYYLSDHDFAECVDKLRSSLRRDGAIIASMIGEQAKDYFDRSEPALDGLRRVTSESPGRSEVYINFTRDEAHLVGKFKGFRALHTGYYCGKFRSDDPGDTFHWTFVGIKS